MGATLLTVVEVDWDDRIRCQAPGCGRSVHRRIHVVRDDERLVVVGSDCWARLYAGFVGTGTDPSNRGAQGRKLTAEERSLLLENTAAFVARMEEEAAASAARVDAERVAFEERRRRAADRERSRWQPPPVDPHDPPYIFAEGDADFRRADPGALKRYRDDAALSAARELIARDPVFGRFPERWVRRAILRAEEECLARGMNLDEPGAVQRIEAGALELLERHYRP